ncbi:MAG: ABC transporter permease, partial [Chitinophagales bacterium]
PKRGKVSAMVAAQLFNTGKVMPGGIFAIQNEFDNQYTIASLEFVQDVMGYKNEVSGIELKLIEGADEDVVKNNLQISLGDTFKIKTRYEQDEALYQIMQAERWAIVAILGLILLIISFNIVGSLSMLAMEKKRDVAILKAMGAEKSLIRNIFLLEGALGSLIGACVGLLLGIGLCYVQIITGFITLGMQGGFVVEAYPVIVEFRDIFLAFAMVFVISVVASWYPAIKASEQDTNFSE